MQAGIIAATLKAVERGEPVANDPTGKLAASLVTGVVRVGVAMDDKILQVEMTWKSIRETTETGIAQYILNLMRGSRETKH